MQPNKLTWTTRFGITVMTQACTRRHHAQERAALCNALNASDMGWTPACVATNGELWNELVARGLASKV